mgnify:CR=1 FL=1
MDYDEATGYLLGEENKGLSSSPCIVAVHLVANYLNIKFPKKKIIAIFPETGERYAKTMYDLDWLKIIPKAELHLHLEGAIPLEALWDLI